MPPREGGCMTGVFDSLIICSLSNGKVDGKVAPGLHMGDFMGS